MTKTNYTIWAGVIVILCLLAGTCNVVVALCMRVPIAGCSEPLKWDAQLTGVTLELEYRDGSFFPFMICRDQEGRMLLQRPIDQLDVHTLKTIRARNSHWRQHDLKQKRRPVIIPSSQSLPSPAGSPAE